MFTLKDAQDRRKPVVFFFLLLLSVIMLEYSTQGHYKDLDQQMNTLYRDRLVPSNYILRLNDQLHKKQRLLNELPDNLPGVTAAIARSNDSILSLISLYEKTFLTKEELKLWSTFNDDLAAYNVAEAALVSGKLTGTPEAVMTTKFDEAIATLSSLSFLQTQEGFRIQAKSKNILDGNFIQHMLELSLLFVIGLTGIQWFRNQKPVLLVTGITPSAN